MSAPGKSQCLVISMSDQVLVPSFLHLQGAFEYVPASLANALMSGLRLFKVGFSHCLLAETVCSA